MKAVFVPFYFALILVSGSALAADCPGDSMLIEFRVAARDVEPDTALIKKLNEERGSLVEATPQSLSYESIFIMGLAQWISERAHAELQAWMVEEVAGNLCDLAADYFPKTCDLRNRLQTSNPLGMATSFPLLIRKAREELRLAPACYIHRQKNGGPIGYSLVSMLEQHEAGERLDRLLYGLSVDVEKLNPAANANGRLCRREKEQDNEKGKERNRLTPYCGVVVPIVAYGVALEAETLWNSNEDLAVDYYLRQLEKRLRHEHHIEIMTEPGGTYQQLTAFMNAAEGIRQLEKSLQQPGGLDRAEVVRILLTITGELVVQLRALEPTLRPVSDKPESMMQALQTLLQLMYIHGDLLAREYASAISRLVDLAQAIDGDENVNYELLAATLPIAHLAEAKSPSEFSETLDSIAAPLGAYRLRRSRNMWSLNAYAGVSIGQQTLSLRDGDSTRVAVASPVAAIGAAGTWQGKRPFGVFVQLLDLGNLINDVDLSGDFELSDGEVSGSIDTDLSDVFTPGLFFVWSPFEAPITLGLGGSYGPRGYRTVTFDDGTSAEADREWRYAVFVAVDIVIWPF